MQRGAEFVTGLMFLSACGGEAAEQSGTDSMTNAQVQAAVDTVQLKPGQWQGRFIVQDIDMSAMPAGAPTGINPQMKNMMSRTALRYCITAQQAANPSGEMFAGKDSRDCRYHSFTVHRGKVKGEMSCKTHSGTMTAVMTGAYGADSYAMTMVMTMTGGDKGRNMALKARSEGKWISPACMGTT